MTRFSFKGRFFFVFCLSLLAIIMTALHIVFECFVEW